MRLHNVTIARRLAAAFGIVGALLAVSAVVSYRASTSQETSAARIARAMRVADDAEQIKFRAADVNGWQTAYAFDVARGIAGATDDTVGSRKAFLASVAAFHTDVATFESGPTDAAEKANIVKVVEAFDKFMALDVEIIAAYRAGDPTSVARAHGLVANEEIELFNAMAADIDTLVEDIKGDQVLALAASRSSGSNARTTILGMTTLALLLAAVFALIVTRSITRPLDRLRDRLANIADGDGDLTQRLDGERRDELGAVARAFNRFVEKVATTVRAIADHATVIAGSAEELSAVSRQMTGSSESVTDQAGHSSSTAAEVSANVGTVAAATEEMTVAINEIARGSAEATEAASQAMHVVSAAQDNMGRLRHSSAQIDQVAKLIGGIAEQTNLLALNATIEAARAGESGKGFAVVANEVKDLATRSAEATSEISTQIAAIQTEVHAAVGSMSEISDAIEHVNQTFASIAASVEEQSATTAEISRNVQQVSMGAERIASDVTVVARAAAEVSEGASGTEQAAVELSHLSNELRQLVSQFRY